MARSAKQIFKAAEKKGPDGRYPFVHLTDEEVGRLMYEALGWGVGGSYGETRVTTDSGAVFFRPPGTRKEYILSGSGYRRPRHWIFSLG